MEPSTTADPVADGADAVVETPAADPGPEADGGAVEETTETASE